VETLRFGVLLRRLRVAADLSQEALAERARISAKAVGALELGTRRAPYKETVEQLIIALNAGEAEGAQLAVLAERARVRGPRSGSAVAVPPSLENLPSPATRLVGREEELARAGDLLTKHRFVTLVGAGGVGKTRVAVSVARLQRAHFRDGVWFVDLAPLADSLQVPHTIAAALGIAGRPGGDILDRIVDFLRERTALVLLDNCEHLLDAIARFVRAVLERSEKLRVLATSREPIHIAGEAVYEILALACPPPDSVLTVETARKYHAVELFVERAASYDAAFALADAQVDVVGTIVRRLDGLPLAIELAAARVRALGLAAVEQRLHRRFELLSGGDRIAPSRQQTMRALIQWSYNLLSPAERLLFCRLSIFAGGWTLEAAELVCGDEQTAQVIDGLASLIEKSLVVRVEQRESCRYRLLESMRDFARETLAQSELDPLARRHATWVETVLEEANERTETEGAKVPLSELLSELENIRAALQWCQTSNEYDLGARIASRIANPFYWYGLAEEGTRWIERALQQINQGEHADVTARLFTGLARLAGDANVRLNAAERAVDIAQRLADLNLQESAYARYAVALYSIGKLDEALAANDRALALSQRRVANPDLRRAWQLQHRSWILVELQRFDEARASMETAIAVFTHLGAKREAWGVRGDLAELEFAAGRTERALEIVDEATATAADVEDLERQSVLICNRAGYLLKIGDFTEAEACAREAISLALKTYGTERVFHALEHLAAAIASRGDLENAALLAGFVEAGYSNSGYERETTERSSHEILVDALNHGLSEAGLSRFMRAGALMTKDQAVEKALAR
jgi:predicted ATPase/DNA-binding XRE family transcriptional regulator